MAEKYPVGIQSFSELVQKGMTYVDKTPLIHELLFSETSGQKNFFLSRPRRFGKSLLISTLGAILEGKKELFQGYWIYDKIQWESHPIIHLSMTEIDFARKGLVPALQHRLREIAEEHEVVLKDDSLNDLIKALYKRYQQTVVILVDEYDKPIIHGLEQGDVALAEKHRDIMKDFYGGLKDLGDYLRFFFITGVSKFARVSIFSDLNHLSDISLDQRFATLCGYTHTELTTYFPQGIQRLAQNNGLTVEACLAKVKDWYNGFSWDGEHFVYNPFSTLRLLETLQFGNYWFETGTPTFLVKQLREKEIFQLTKTEIHIGLFQTFDLYQLDTLSLLLQTGYFTLKRKLDEFIFETDFPNQEVRESFNQMLLGAFLQTHAAHSGLRLYQIGVAFEKNDIPKVMQIIETMFHSLPSELFEKKDKKGNSKPVGENFYHAIIYLIFNLLGVKMHAEVSVFPPQSPQWGVRGGRIDAMVETAEHLYLFEFKKDQSPQTALTQMQNRNYAASYALKGKTIHLIGVNFSLSKRGIGAEDWAEVVV